MRKLSVRPPCRLTAASRLATKTAKATARTGFQILLGTRPGLVLGEEERRRSGPTAQSLATLGVHLPSTTSARSTSLATAAARASAHLCCAAYRRSQGTAASWEWPAARNVAMREPRHAIAGGAWGRRRWGPHCTRQPCGIQEPNGSLLSDGPWRRRCFPERVLIPCGGTGWPVNATMELEEPLQESLVAEFRLQEGDIQRDCVARRGARKDPWHGWFHGQRFRSGKTAAPTDDEASFVDVRAWEHSWWMIRRTRSAHSTGWHRDPDPVGKRNAEMCVNEDVAARLVRFQNAMYTCPAGLGKAFAQFRVRSKIRWTVVSVHRKSRRRYKVTFRMSCREFVRGVSDKREPTCGGASVCGVLLLRMCACVLSAGEPQSRMRLRWVSFPGTAFLSSVATGSCHRTSIPFHDFPPTASHQQELPMVRNRRCGKWTNLVENKTWDNCDHQAGRPSGTNTYELWVCTNFPH